MKIIKIITISLCIILIFSQNVFATTALGNIFSTGESWISLGNDNANTTINTENLRDASNQLYNILLAAATCVAVIVGAFLGVQYMTAGISKKVEVKESLFPYFISCVVVFGSFGIWKLVVTIMAEI